MYQQYKIFHILSHMHIKKMILHWYNFEQKLFKINLSCHAKQFVCFIKFIENYATHYCIFTNNALIYKNWKADLQRSSEEYDEDIVHRMNNLNIWWYCPYKWDIWYREEEFHKGLKQRNWAQHSTLKNTSTQCMQ